MSTKSKKSFSERRNALHQTLRRYPNVVAFGWGTKMTAGLPTGKPCLTVYVKKKHGKEDLNFSEIIPESMKHGRNMFLTDVVELGHFTLQSAPENYPFGDCLSDSLSNGTRSSYVKTNEGILALTCAHVVAGSDRDPFTPAAVNSFDWNTMSWKAFGFSDRAVYQTGSLVPLDFGYIDAALVKILPDLIHNIPFSSQPRSFLRPSGLEDILRLRGTIVNGFGIASGSCQGVINSVLVSSVDEGRLAADFIVAALNPSGLTRVGDSGMIWQNSEGLLIGQHTRGNQAPPGQGSQLTIASFIYRIREKLQIISFH